MSGKAGKGSVSKGSAGKRVSGFSSKGGIRRHAEEPKWTVDANFKPPRKISDRELEAARKMFFELDRDGSGSIDAEELGMMLRSLGQNPSEEELKELGRRIGMHAWSPRMESGTRPRRVAAGAWAEGAAGARRCDRGGFSIAVVGPGRGLPDPYGGGWCAAAGVWGVWRVGVVCGRGARAVPEMRKAEYLLNMSSILCAGASATKTDYAPARLRLLSRAHLKRPPAQTVNSKHTTRGTPPDLRKGKLSRPECNFTFPSPDRLLARARLAEPP